MNPKSPDRALQQAYSEAEGALARIAHVNRLSRDIMDIKEYDLDLAGGTNGLLRIFSKRGIVTLKNINQTSSDLAINLQNDEIDDPSKFYIQLSVFTSGNAIPIIFAYPLPLFPGPANTFGLRIRDIDSTQNWGTIIFYYDLVKID